MFGSIVMGLVELALRIDDRLEQRRKEQAEAVRAHERALRAELEAAERRRQR